MPVCPEKKTTPANPTKPHPKTNKKPQTKTKSRKAQAEPTQGDGPALQGRHVAAPGALGHADRL